MTYDKMHLCQRDTLLGYTKGAYPNELPFEKLRALQKKRNCFDAVHCRPHVTHDLMAEGTTGKDLMADELGKCKHRVAKSDH